MGINGTHSYLWHVFHKKGNYPIKDDSLPIHLFHILTLYSFEYASITTEIVTQDIKDSFSLM